MSIKTTFKRVALVTVAGLGLGLLTSVSAQAAANDFTVVTAQASPVPVNGTSATATQIAGATNFATFDVELAASSSYALTVTGGVATCAVNTATGTVFAGNGSAAVSATTSTTAGLVRCTTPTTAAGTITVDLFGFTNGVQNSTRSSRLTITVTVTPVVNTSYSTLFIASGTNTPSSITNAAKVLAPGALVSGASVQAANILVTIKDQNNVAFDARGVTATVSGPGALGINADATVTNAAATGRAVSISSTGADNTAVVTVWNDGTTGVATITLSSGTTTLGTKTVTFYGAVTKLTATQNLKVARASADGAQLGCSIASCTLGSSAANIPAVYIAATDVNGNPVPGLTITSVISNTLVIASSANTQDDATAGDGPGYYNASVTSAPVGTSGASATVTYRTTVGTTVISSDPVTFTLGGSTRNSTITLNKATYEPGEAMIVTRTATDSAGNPVYDGEAALAVTFSKLTGGTAPGDTQYRNGTRATSSTAPTVFAPSFEGGFIASFTGVTDGVAATKSTTAVVTDLAATIQATAAIDAASEATDAANAATDAANAAAEAADAATAAAQDAADAVAALSVSVSAMIDTLKKQITALTNLVIKIQKKVKA